MDSLLIREACSRPKPVLLESNKVFVCSDCGYILGVIEYERNGAKMQWWRHHKPGPVEAVIG